MQLSVTLKLFRSLVILSGISLATVVQADEAPFYPIWRNLDRNSQELYVSGYLHGLRDAEEIIRIARDYVKDNPNLALQSLDKVRKICSVRDVSANIIVPEVNSYYSNIENQEGSFSNAIGFAQQQVRATR